MTAETQVVKIGDSLGIVLPQKVVQAMGAKEGVTLFLSEGTQSSFCLTPECPAADDMVHLAERGMDKYRNALSELVE